AYRNECEKAAAWLVDFIKKRGMEAEVIATSHLPLVMAQDLSAGEKKPTVLVYGHYDVQPVDPLELWHSPPFEPTERNGSIFARGAVDDKGQIFYAVLAALAWKDLGHPLPVNLKFCIEGEEEFGSQGLSKALPKLKAKMKADYLVVVDFDQFDRGIPAISMGARGISSLEVILKGSKGDLHSGIYGGIAYNPNRALALLLSKLWDAKGRVQVPGFYDDVVECSQKEMEMYACRYDRDYYLKQVGIEAFGGEEGKSIREANYFRPTLEINGIVGGYTGAGIKTVIPATASAKITCRLVPNQDPEKINQAVAAFLKKQVVKGMKVEVIFHPGSPAFRGNRNSKIVKAIASAATELTGKECKYVLAGGSIPVVSELVKATSAEVVGMGVGLLDDQIHAPNEHFDMERFEEGFLTFGRALSLI
ncbi:MAG: dipeptidase, partial [Chlamydiae bacterium]|nr:dipeptidase [Chlamydiota bacterium]